MKRFFLLATMIIFCVAPLSSISTNALANGKRIFAAHRNTGIMMEAEMTSTAKPGAMALMGIGMIGLATLQRKRFEK